MQKFFGPQFLWEARLRLLYGSLLGRLTTRYLESSVEFLLLISICEVRSLATKQNTEFTEGG